LNVVELKNSMDFINSINNDVGYFYSSFRCLILFCLSVLFIRFTNHRFNFNTPLDFLMITISGGLISRGIVGASSLGITVEAFLMLLILHKILAKLCFKFNSVGFLFKGCSHYLIENGEWNYRNMSRYNISENDLLEQLRQKLNTENYKIIEYALLERTGNISFILKDDK
jgi:uncharacterized membrane protein YcaP (DUF421 family)